MPIAALLSGVLLLAGCSDGHQYLDPQPTGPSMSKQQQQAQLATRPTLAEAIAAYEKLRVAIRERLSSEFGLPPWVEYTDSVRFSGCGQQFAALTEQEASTKFLSRWSNPTSLLPQWDKVKQLVREVAGTYGFAAVSLDANRNGDAEFNLNDQYGAELSISAAKNTLLALTTGCHLINK
jgi:hypothetical protein